MLPGRQTEAEALMYGECQPNVTTPPQKALGTATFNITF